jgi:hypothetical protein
MWFALLAGCVEAFHDCDPLDLGETLGVNCDPVELCCAEVSRYEVQCAIVREDTREYPCTSENNCTSAILAAICDVCDIEPATSDCLSETPTGRP